MKPTLDQQKRLQKYLRKNLTYSETCTEFYDHILTAIEGVTDGSFEDAVNRVINNDFGGFEVLIEIEDRYKKQIIKEMQKRYLGYILDCFKFPFISIVMIGSIMAYYIVKQPWFNFSWFCIIFFPLAVIPSLLNSTRYLRSGYFFRKTNRSVKDDGFKWLKYLPGAMFMIIWLFNSWYLDNSYPANWFKHANPVILTIIFMIYAIHAIAFYKIYRDEYNINIAGA